MSVHDDGRRGQGKLLGCSPKLGHTFSLVATGHGAHLSSLRCFVSLLFSLNSNQQVLSTANKSNETALNTTLIFTLNLSLVFTLSKVLSTLPLPIKRSANSLFSLPLKVLGRPRIISNINK